mmetsp:Transcript_47532/g.150712  ORF Transcript_47532/g.150712 Transcript_47532/m.150712 type:complete len:243 (-) Transcript_47532:317-1045(-)
MPAKRRKPRFAAQLALLRSPGRSGAASAAPLPAAPSSAARGPVSGGRLGRRPGRRTPQSSSLGASGFGFRSTACLRASLRKKPSSILYVGFFSKATGSPCPAGKPRTAGNAVTPNRLATSLPPLPALCSTTSSLRRYAVLSALSVEEVAPELLKISTIGRPHSRRFACAASSSCAVLTRSTKFGIRDVANRTRSLTSLACWYSSTFLAFLTDFRDGTNALIVGVPLIWPSRGGVAPFASVSQ